MMSDLGSTNKKLHNHLNVSSLNPSFGHPSIVSMFRAGRIALEMKIIFQCEHGDTFSKKTKVIDRITEQVFYSFFN